jgi:hypothetical protein
MSDQLAADGGPKEKRHALRAQVILPCIILFVIGSGWALIYVPNWLLVNWYAGVAVSSAALRLSLGNAAQIVLFALGGVIALVGVSLSLARHGLELDNAVDSREKEALRVKELDHDRRVEAERELRSRFAQAVTLLSDVDKPTTRQAGVYALGALVDDWKAFGRIDEMQVCIDVLCGYLRSRYSTKDASANDERRVRSAAFNLIGSHFRPGDRPSWDGAAFNIRGAYIDYEVDFWSAQINESDIDLRDAIFAGGTQWFDNMVLAGGRVRFDGATFSGSTVKMDNTTLDSGTIRFNGCRLIRGNISLEDSIFTGGSLRLDKFEFRGGDMSFEHVRFAGSSTTFNKVEFTGGKVWLDEAEFRVGQVVVLQGVFDKGIFSFNDVVFNGGSIEVGGQVFSSAPVIIPWVDANS